MAAAAAASLSLTTPCQLHASTKLNSKYSRLTSCAVLFNTFYPSPTCYSHKLRNKSLTVYAATEGSAKSSKSADDKIPSWAQPDSVEPPPWARDEANESIQQTYELPFYVYLLASAITAIAAIGSIFEYINQKPVFGLVDPDSIIYAPLLGFFAFTGLPTSAFLWYKSVQSANKAAEEQDMKDGYR